MSASHERTRDEQQIERLRSRRSGLWPAIRWLRKRRPILTALIVLVAPAHTLATDARAFDLLVVRADPRFVAAWVLAVLGVTIRIWGSGNLRKNQEITRVGVYAMVRHPLYTGSLSMFLAYFLVMGDLRLGLALFILLLVGVYYPTMLAEEEYLELRFPEQAKARAGLPRLIPNPFRFKEALRTDRFSLAYSRSNLGLRSLGFLIVLPVAVRLIQTLDG